MPWRVVAFCLPLFNIKSQIGLSIGRVKTSYLINTAAGAAPSVVTKINKTKS